MKSNIIVGVVCAFITSVAVSGAEEWKSLGEQAAMLWGSQTTRAHLAPPASTYGSLDTSRSRAALLVAQETRKRLGDRWVATALKIVKVESGYRCNAINRRSGAAGLGQLMFNSARSLEPGSEYRRTDCETGARLTALHMQSCLMAGVTTDAQMASCHVAGVRGWNRHLARWAERYKKSYTRMVAVAEPTRIAFNDGWLSRGSVAINQ